MARTRYTNTVPLGQEGTGAAQIFGPSRALQHYLGVANREQDRLQRQQEQANQIYAQNTREFNRYINDISQKVSTPMYGQEKQKRLAELTQKAAELRSRGVDVLNPSSGNISDPDAVEVRAGFNDLLAGVEREKEINNYRARVLQDFAKDPTKYRQSDIDALTKFADNVSYDDFRSGNYTLPQITPRVNYLDDGTKAKFGSTVQEVVETKLPDGRVRMETVTKPNVEQLLNQTEAAFRNPNYQRDIEKEIQEKTGDLIPFSALLHTTDRDEVREQLDARMKAINAPGSQDNNPAVQLMAAGEITGFDDPKYQEFLDEYTDEWLEAEKILANAKNDYMVGMQSNIDQKNQVKYDSSEVNNARAAARERRAQEAHNLAQQQRRTSIAVNQARLSGTLPDGSSSVLDEASDSVLSPEDSEHTIVGFDAIPFNGGSISMKPSDKWNASDGSKVAETKSPRLNITSLATVAIDKNGNIVSGDNPEELAKNPNVKEFRTVAVMSNHKGRTELRPISNIPSESFSGPKKKEYGSKKKAQDSITEQYNKMMKSDNSQSLEDINW